MFKQKQNDPQVLQHQTGQGQISLIQSIPQKPKNIPSIGLDSFSGTVREFKAYIKLNQILIENGLAT